MYSRAACQLFMFVILDFVRLTLSLSLFQTHKNGQANWQFMAHRLCVRVRMLAHAFIINRSTMYRPIYRAVFGANWTKNKRYTRTAYTPFICDYGQWTSDHFWWWWWSPPSNNGEWAEPADCSAFFLCFPFSFLFDCLLFASFCFIFFVSRF